MYSIFEAARDWLLSCPSFDGNLFSVIPEMVRILEDFIFSDEAPRE